MIYRILVRKLDYIKNEKKGPNRCNNCTNGNLTEDLYRFWLYGRLVIRCFCCDFRLELNAEEAEQFKSKSNWKTESYRLGGAFPVLPMYFNAPKKSFSSRARFYFTQKGWDLHGRDMCKKAYEWGYRNGCNIQVIKRKNPKEGDIAYRDELQVALLPKRKPY